MSSGKKAGADFTCAAVSPKATYAYCAGEDGVVYCFNLQQGDLESFLKVLLHMLGCGGVGVCVCGCVPPPLPGLAWPGLAFYSHPDTPMDTHQVGEKELIGVAHHPHRNLLVTFGDEGVLKLWRP